MDEQCGKIADNQEATLKNWRRLADATKGTYTLALQRSVACISKPNLSEMSRTGSMLLRVMSCKWWTA